MTAPQNEARPARASEYMHWAKTRPCARFDLATSGLANLKMQDLEVSLDELEITGESGYGFPPLIAAIAARHRVDPSCVVTAAGTTFANHLAMAALIKPGDEILLESPTYEPLLALAQYLGAQAKRFPRRYEKGFEISVEDIERNLSERTRLIVITNFHNPSGVLTETQTLREIGEVALKTGVRVLVDEVYLQMLFAEPSQSAFHLGSHFIVTSS